MDNETPTSDTAPEKDQGMRRVLRGVVFKDGMDKTIVVHVKRRVLHKRYKKYVTQRASYKAHDETNDAHVGDTVDIIECRPLSRDKRWRIKKVVERAK